MPVAWLMRRARTGHGHWFGMGVEAIRYDVDFTDRLVIVRLEEEFDKGRRGSVRLEKPRMQSARDGS